MLTRICRSRLPFALALLLVTLVTGTAWAERLPAPQILPEDTLLYVRVANARETLEKFQETSMGRLLRDEQLRPLLSDLYDSADEAYAQIQEQLGGLALEDLLALPQGELCLAVVAPDVGPPALVALFDVGDRLPEAMTLVDRAVSTMEARGGRVTRERVGDAQLTIVERRRDRRLVFFDRETTIAVTSHEELARQLLGTWEGAEEGVRTLADNPKFRTIMSKSAGTKDERPQVSWYFDPVQLFKVAGRGSFQAQAALALLDPLGLNGLKALGGSVVLAPEEFDSIMHLHVLLGTPREGVLEILALDSGNLDPEPWVPADAVSYMTLHWDFQESIDAAAAIYDIVRDEPGALAKDLDRRISEPLGADFQDELLAAFDGRVSMCTYMERPIRLNSQSNLLGIKLKNADAFRPTLEKIVARHSANISQESFGSLRYYKIQVNNPRRPQLDEQLMRRPEPCLAIVGDYLLVTDSPKFLERCVSTSANSSAGLRENLEFKLIASRIRRHAGEATPGMITFGRPEESMRALYELATSENTRALLARQAESNPALRALNDALNRNPLPPFSVVARYLAPNGGMMINDQTGFHYMAFGLKRD